MQTLDVACQIVPRSVGDVVRAMYVVCGCCEVQAREDERGADVSTSSANKSVVWVVLWSKIGDDEEVKLGWEAVHCWREVLCKTWRTRETALKQMWLI